MTVLKSFKRFKDMTQRLYVPVFASTLLLSAFLLFLIQPLYGKMILPLLGGAPAVWNTAMLFFQTLLLAGYAYAHGIARLLSIRAQAIIHIVLLTLFIFVLPISIPNDWMPPVDKNPAFWQLGVMAVTVGGPFFILSGSAPMIQHWFSFSPHKDAHNPYFLYASSNLGSMTSLLAYPFFIEPFLGVPEQSMNWSYGYGLLILFIAASAALIWAFGGKDSAPKAKEEKGKKAKKKADDDEHVITWDQRGKWVLLAFIPSSLMLGVTTYITTDLAAVPLLWILPLALYVGTFIIVFARKPLIPYEVSLKIQAISLILLLATFTSGLSINDSLEFVFHLIAFFFCALTVHFELARLRPHASHLTQFYLFMSIGGALGGSFNALIAPFIFPLPLEYAIMLVAAIFVRYLSTDQKSANKTVLDDIITGVAIGAPLVILPFLLSKLSFITDHANLYAVCLLIILFATVFTLLMISKKRWIFGMCTAVILLAHPPGGGVWTDAETLHTSRNFFGVLRVADTDSGTRWLIHGVTIHGTQALAEEHKLAPLAYYTKHGSLYEGFQLLQTRPDEQKIAVLGLGIGTVACYQKEGRFYDFFEIDPDVADIAENPEYFTFLRDCGSPYEIILGDARLTVQKKPDDHYDAIFMDAFSSDNIPVHLITKNAIEFYDQKLKENGIILINISNRFLDLQPVLARIAETLNFKAFGKISKAGKLEDSGIGYSAASAVVLTRSKNDEKLLLSKGWDRLMPEEDIKLWTDDYSNIVSVLHVMRDKPQKGLEGENSDKKSEDQAKK